MYCQSDYSQCSNRLIAIYSVSNESHLWRYKRILHSQNYFVWCNPIRIWITSGHIFLMLGCSFLNTGDDILRTPGCRCSPNSVSSVFDACFFHFLFACTRVYLYFHESPLLGALFCSFVALASHYLVTKCGQISASMLHLIWCWEEKLTMLSYCKRIVQTTVFGHGTCLAVLLQNKRRVL